MTKDATTEEDQADAKRHRARGEFVRGAEGYGYAIGQASMITWRSPAA